MKKRMVVLVTAFMLIGTHVYAGNGDLLVNGKLGVGVGIIIPTQKLTIDLGSTRDGMNIVSDGDANAYSDLQFNVKTTGGLAATDPYIWELSHRKDGYFSGSSGPSLEFYGVKKAGGYYAPLAFKSNGDVIITSSKNATTANVGIGTTAPAYKLDVNGTINASGGINTQGGASYYTGIGISTASNALSTTDLDYNRAGVQPIQRINYHTGISMSAHTAYGGIRFYNQGYSNSNSNPYDSSIGAQMVMAINGGNVGIGAGMSNPVASLQVARGTGVYGTAAFLGTTNVSHFNYSTSEDTYIRGGKSGSVVHINDGSIGNVNLVENNGGNVGIGTASPKTTLHIMDSTKYPTIRLGDPINSNGLDIWASSLGGYLQASWSSIPSYLILNPSGGYVGVGGASQSYKFYVAGTSYSTGGWLSSDLKFKKNIKPIGDSLGNVLKMQGHSYEWKTEEYKERGFPEGRHYGVIAQEIEKVLPEVVNTASDGTKAVAYTEIIPVLIEAIKEQQKRIDLLEKKLAGIGK